MNEDRVLSLFADIAKQYVAYHNHKETSAWAAVALWLAIVLQVSTSLVKQAGLVCSSRCLIVSTLVVGAALVLFYLCRQFELTRDAANYVAACTALSGEIVSGQRRIENPLELAPPSNGDRRTLASHTLPRLVLETATRLESGGQGSRRFLERVGYALVIASTLVGIGIAMLRPQA